jgi:hypothetical protein
LYGISGHFVAFHDISLHFIAFHGMAFHGILWPFLAFPGIYWHLLVFPAFHGISWPLHGITCHCDEISDVCKKICRQIDKDMQTKKLLIVWDHTKKDSALSSAFETMGPKLQDFLQL